MVKSDEEILKEYYEIMEKPLPTEKWQVELLIQFVNMIRKDEPRINSGYHLLDYTMICDENDDMDSFYGKDYFKN